MSGLALAAHQFRYDQKVFWRNPSAVGFTVLFPLMFLVLFELLFGSGDLEGLHVDSSEYYIPAIVTLAVVSATFQNLAMSVTIDREEGLLKRSRGTPLPSWVFIAGRVGNSLVIATLMLVLVAVLGKLAYGVAIPWGHLPAILVTLALGAATFSCLGLALTAAIPSDSAAAPITNLVIFPLYFLSGVFVPESEVPDGVIQFSGIFPVRPFFEAFFTAWDPNTTGAGFRWGQLALLAAWGVGGLVIALRTFRWEPRSGAR
jgi:ABC-2 type transport system permease protein